MGGAIRVASVGSIRRADGGRGAGQHPTAIHAGAADAAADGRSARWRGSRGEARHGWPRYFTSWRALPASQSLPPPLASAGRASSAWARPAGISCRTRLRRSSPGRLAERGLDRRYSHVAHRDGNCGLACHFCWRRDLAGVFPRSRRRHRCSVADRPLSISSRRRLQANRRRISHTLTLESDQSLITNH